MIVVITSEGFRKEESREIVELLNAGVDRIHIRKPLASSAQLLELIAGIDSKYHQQISIHQHHEMAETFPLLGLHYREMDRTSLNAANMIAGRRYSSSFHAPKDLEENVLPFTYAFLSPVFDSISKEGYSGKGFHAPKVDFPVIALGGINSENANRTRDLGYDGIAVLGAIWNSEDPVSNFVSFKEKYDLQTA